VPQRRITRIFVSESGCSDGSASDGKLETVKPKHTPIKGAKQRALQFASKKDDTYDPETGEPAEYPDGYQGSFVRPNAFDKLSDDEWDEISNYLAEKYDSKEHIGVYDGTAETSFHIKNLDDAEELMYTFNQDNILDWAKKHLAGNPDWEIAKQAYIMNETPEEERTEVDYDEVLRRIRAT